MVKNKIKNNSIAVKDNVTVNVVDTAVRGIEDAAVKTSYTKSEGTSPEAAAAESVIRSPASATRIGRKSYIMPGRMEKIKKESSHIKQESQVGTQVMFQSEAVLAETSDLLQNENYQNYTSSENVTSAASEALSEDIDGSSETSGSVTVPPSTAAPKKAEENESEPDAAASDVRFREKRRQDALKRLQKKNQEQGEKIDRVPASQVGTQEKNTYETKPVRKEKVSSDKRMPARLPAQDVRIKKSNMGLKDKASAGFDSGVGTRSADVKLGYGDIKSDYVPASQVGTQGRGAALVVVASTSRAAGAVFGIVKSAAVTIKKVAASLLGGSWAVMVAAGVILAIIVSTPLFAFDGLGDDAGETAEELSVSADNSIISIITEELKKAGWAETAEDIVQIIGSAASKQNTVALYYAMKTGRNEAPDIKELYMSMHDISVTKNNGIIFNSGRYDACDDSGNIRELFVEIEETDNEGNAVIRMVQKDGDDAREPEIHAPQNFNTWTVTVTEKSTDDLKLKYNLSEMELDLYNFYLSEEGQEFVLDSVPEEYFAEDNENKMISLALEEYEKQNEDPEIKSGEKYRRWFGFDEQVQTDTIFLSWLAAESGYIDSYFLENISGADGGSIRDKGSHPFTSSAAWAAEWFKARGLWRAAEDYKPKAGDYVFWDTDGDGTADKTGLISGEEVIYFDGEIKRVSIAAYAEKMCGYGSSCKLFGT